MMSLAVLKIGAGLSNSLDPPTRLKPSPWSSPTLGRRAKVPNASPSATRSMLPTLEIVPLKDSDNSDEEIPHPKILVRRFTLADPLIVPGT